MTHLDPSTLATYNSLADPHLQSYFSNERIRSHLKNAGLITDQGEIISDGEYRSKLARREHMKHVRHVLAENIVNRAIDIERTRQAEMKRQFELVAKAALVNNLKESKRRGAHLSGLTTNSNDIALLSIDIPCLQTRPKSASYQNQTCNEQVRMPRLQSGHVSDDYQAKYSSDGLDGVRRRRRRGRRFSQRPKSSNIKRSSPVHRSHSPKRNRDSLESAPCQITMVYYGPHTKVDYDHLVFEETTEVIVMQQHCGGENLVVYKNFLKPGDQFTFDSRRHSDYPFGLSFYVKGLIDNRISTCCEYKHRNGVRLGGDRGHFAIKSVVGSKPCIKCRYEKEARLKRFAQSPKEKDDETKKPITISIPVSDEPKPRQTPISIPVRLTSISNDNYSEDFEDLNKSKHSAKADDTAGSSSRRLHSGASKSKSKDLTTKTRKQESQVARKELLATSDSNYDKSPKENQNKKTWQIIIHVESLPIEDSKQGKYFITKNSSLQFSFIAKNRKNETEVHQIPMKKLTKNIGSIKQYAFKAEFKNIGKPENIRLKICNTEKDSEDEDDDDDDDDDEYMKWYLKRIEVIDPETQCHLEFPCGKAIPPSQEQILNLLQKRAPDVPKRRISTSQHSSRSSSSDRNHLESSKIKAKVRTPSHSTTSSDSPKQQKPIDYGFDESQTSTPRNTTTKQDNKTRYRVTICPSHDDDGEFNPTEESCIFLRLNNHTEETYLIDKKNKPYPVFDSGKQRTFELDLIKDIDEQPEKITIGYISSDPTARSWKLDKIIIVNIKTGDETIFPCNQPLIRNESNFRAEKTFEIQLQELGDEGTPRKEKVITSKYDHDEATKTSERQGKNTNDNNRNKKRSSFQRMDSNDDNDKEVHRSPSIQTTNNNNKNNDKVERSPSFQTMNDDDADYKTIFKQLDPADELGLGSTPHSPSSHSSIRQEPSKQEYINPTVDPLPLSDLADQTPRSNDPLNPSSLPSTTTDQAEKQFKNWYSRNSDNDDDDDI